METIICDISAFDYWRMPPLVRHLLADDETNPKLRSIMREEEILALRAAVAQTSFAQKMLTPNPAMRNVSRAVKNLKPAALVLAASHQGAIDIAVTEHRRCYASNTIRPRFSNRETPLGATTAIEEYISIANPPLALLQLAGRASLIRTIMLTSEICGAFTVYHAPQPIRAALQKIAKSGPFPQVNGWRPFINSNGVVTDLWSRPPLATPSDLLNFAKECSARKGCQNLRLAAQLATPNAASPLEVQAGMLLGLSRRRGGEGYAEFSFNKRIDLSPGARAIAQRDHCYCDLYWEDGLDVECQSAAVHDKAASFLSDSDRTTALKSMGIDVIPVTYGQLASEQRFAELSKTIAKARGKRFRPKTVHQIEATRILRKELFVNWGTIHRV